MRSGHAPFGNRKAVRAVFGNQRASEHMPAPTVADARDDPTTTTSTATTSTTATTTTTTTNNMLVAATELDTELRQLKKELLVHDEQSALAGTLTTLAKYVGENQTGPHLQMFPSSGDCPMVQALGFMVCPGNFFTAEWCPPCEELLKDRLHKRFVVVVVVQDLIPWLTRKILYEVSATEDVSFRLNIIPFFLLTVLASQPFRPVETSICLTTRLPRSACDDTTHDA